MILESRLIPAVKADAPTLVFLHEGLGSLGLWRDFPQRLAERTGYSALVYSRFGYGQSPVLASARPAEYMRDEALVVLPQLFDEYGLRARETILVGHSDGATIALIFAGSLPESQQPQRIIVEAPHLFVEPESIDGIRAARVAFESGDLRERMAKHHRDVDATFYGWNDVWLSNAFSDMNIEPDCARIAVPILAIQGLADAYGTLTQLDRLQQLARGPVTRCEIPGCGHSPHREKPAETLEAMVDFLTVAARNAR